MHSLNKNAIKFDHQKRIIFKIVYIVIIDVVCYCFKSLTSFKARDLFVKCPNGLIYFKNLIITIINVFIFFV